TRLFAACMAMSHSSRAQGSCSHQSPEERQGPACHKMSPPISFLFALMRAGMPSHMVTVAAIGGRKRRKAVTVTGSGAGGSPVLLSSPHFLPDLFLICVV